MTLMLKMYLWISFRLVWLGFLCSTTCLCKSACDVFRVVLGLILALDFGLASRNCGVKRGLWAVYPPNHHSELSYMWQEVSCSHGGWRSSSCRPQRWPLCHSSSNDAVSRHPHPIVHGAHTFRTSTYVVVPRSVKALQLALIRSLLTPVIKPVEVTI